MEFLNLGLTLIVGDPISDTRELPYAKVVLQIILAIGVVVILPGQVRTQWLLVLLPLAIWVLARAVDTGTALVWATALYLLLMHPLLSVLLSTRVTPT